MIQEQYSDAAKAIVTQHYIDDYLGGADDNGKCNWILNSEKIIASIHNDLVSEDQKKCNNIENFTKRILSFW